MRTLALVVVIAVPAFAQTVYSWENADGVHYTDDLAQVPKAKKVEEQVLEGRPLSKGLSAPRTNTSGVTASSPRTGGSTA